MSRGDNSPGMAKLAGTIRELASKDIDKSLKLDFGSIQSDGSLLTNTYPIPIPKTDYIVCRHLKKRVVTVTSTAVSAGSHTAHSHSATVAGETGSTSSVSVQAHGTHTHQVSIETQRNLKAGDRVLVAWVQNDAVVVDVILQASSVL